MAKPIKHKLIGSILCLGIGILLLVYNFTYSQSEEVHDYILGFVIGIVSVAIYYFGLAFLFSKNEKLKHDIETKRHDERYRYLYHMAMACTFRISIFLEGVASIVCAFLNQMSYAEMLGLLVGIQLIIYLIFYTLIKIKH